MKDLKKLLCVLIALTILTATLVACKKKDNNESDSVSGDVSESSTEDVEEYDEKGYLKDDLDTMDFGGKEIRVLGWKEKTNEMGISAEQMSANPVNSAVYLRNVQVEKRMKLKFKYNYVTGAHGTMSDYLKAAEAAETSNEVDVYASYSRVASSLMTRGYTTNLLDLEYLDFEKPWWSRSLIEKATIYDRLYFASGDIAPSLFENAFIMYFNKDMADIYLPDKLSAKGADSLYDLVSDGKWTLDTMIEFCKDVGSSVDDIKDSSDTFGFACSPISLDAFYQGSGMSALTVNNDGSIALSDDMSSVKVHDLIETLVTFLKTKNAVSSGTYGGTEIEALKSWDNGRTLFYLEPVAAATKYSNAGLKFGILPVPKYDADQVEGYITTTGFHYTMWSVSRTEDDELLEAVGAGLECMASESHRLVSPAHYDTMLRAQTSDSAEDYKMWETIKASVEIESGRVMDDMFNGQTWGLFRDCVMMRTTDYMSDYATASIKLNQGVLSLNRIMSSIETVYGN